MKILLTGAHGPLGRRVLLGLRDEHELLVLARPGELDSVRSAEWGVPVIEADPLCPQQYGERIRGVQALLHLDQDAQGSDGQLIERNLKATQSLLHAFSAFGDPELLITLSSALLDHPSPDEPDVDASAFGSTWLATLCAAEARVGFFARRSGVETCIVRAGHPFGALGSTGALTGWLEAAAAAAESGTHLELPGAQTPLPFVHMDELARSIVARVQGQAMPGERRFVAKLSRVDAVSLLASFEQLHQAMCRQTFREPPPLRTSLGGRLVRRIKGELLPDPELPRYLEVQPMRLPNPDWVATYGPRSRAQVVEALVGGAC